MAALFVLKGTNAGQHLPLDGDTVIVGRSPDCEVVLPATSVSRQHARLMQLQGLWYIEDMRSRNGTFVNNQPIKTRTLLHHNDRIRVCDFAAAFHESVLATLPPELTSAEGDEHGSTANEPSTGNSSKILASQPAENLRIILEISNNLVKALELDQLLPRIVDSLMELFKQADRCFLILDDGHGRLECRASRTRAPQAGNITFSATIVERCLKTAQAFVTEDAGSDVRLRDSDSAGALKLCSAMCVPLASGDGKVFGVIQLDTSSRSKKFTNDDLKLLWGVANQAAVAIQNAHLHEDLLVREQLERDLEVAGQVQRSLLPEHLPELAGYDFFAHYDAALMVGGDYYDFIALPRQRLAVTLGDVAGKGVSAALLMAKLSAETRTAFLAEPELSAAVARLNEALYPHTHRSHRFVTLAAAVLDPERQTATLVNAGHLPPLLYRKATGAIEEALPRSAAGTVLGMDRGVCYPSFQVTLQPGDCLLLFTDGVCEAMNNYDKRFILEGIHEVLGGGGPYCPRTLGERLVNALEQQAVRGSQQDDVTLVCFGRRG